MLHEILLRLWHDTGDGDSQLLNSFELQEFLHPGERQLLQNILDIASKYHWIVSFCKSVQKHNLEGHFNETGINQNGLYIKAFANGVVEVLGDYRNAIVELEQTFLQNPQLSLTLILSCLEKHQVLFNMLKSVIEVVQNEELHGCLLMGRLHKYIHCGVERISNAAERISHSLNAIFYRHLANWIICGNLVDIHNEFFICDGKCHDENFLYPEHSEEISSAFRRIKNRISMPPPVRKFYIDWKMVPIFLNEDLAESILFMGRIVWIVRNDPKTGNDDVYQIKVHRDVWEGKEYEYYKRIQNLESETFNEVEFQKVIEECRIKLTKFLWSVMLDEGNLKQHLQLIRDYYALGRGELFNQFILMAENNLKNSEHNAYNLNCAFLETARKIYGENDESYLRFQLSTSKVENTSNLWSKIQLNFEIRWPLHIIFHPKSMELYNKLFCYLLRLNRTKVHLHKLWNAQIVRKQNIHRRVWTLRQNLIFLVNNLHYYLQVDVIEAQFSLLLKAVENANEFEDIIKLHHEFISTLLAKTFVLTPDDNHTYQNKHQLHQIPAVQVNVPSQLSIVIIRLLELCDKFCVFANTWEAELTEPELLELEEFEKQTDTIVETFLFMLQRLHAKANGPHLLQLLYQLDFNRYFSKKKFDFNITQDS